MPGQPILRQVSERGFCIEVVGHASLRVRDGGVTLLTDPWLVEPLGCARAFPFPPLVHTPEQLAAETDAIYLSHPHPDHFSPATLACFPKHVPIYIGRYGRPQFRDAVRALGFPVIEVPFGERVPVEETPLTITILRHDEIDSAACDSAIVVETPTFTVMENNDCYLAPATYDRVRERFRPDYAFLGYSPASFFPINFEMPEDEKTRLLAEASEERYAAFVDTARRLGASLSVPFASGLRFLAEWAVWKNVLFNSAPEAVRRLRAVELAGAVMGPGDRIHADGSISRRSPVRERDDELAAIAAYARSVGVVPSTAADEPMARADLAHQLCDYLLRRWRAMRDTLPGVRNHVVAYVLRGTTEQRFYFDFSRPEGGIFQWGTPARYDMRYSYPAAALQRTLDGAIDWDELHFLGDVSIHQVRYAKDFYAMLRSELTDPLERGQGGQCA